MELDEKISRFIQELTSANEPVLIVSSTKGKTLLGVTSADADVMTLGHMFGKAQHTVMEATKSTAEKIREMAGSEAAAVFMAGVMAGLLVEPDESKRVMQTKPHPHTAEASESRKRPA